MMICRIPQSSDVFNIISWSSIVMLAGLVLVSNLFCYLSLSPEHSVSQHPTHTCWVTHCTGTIELELVSQVQHKIYQTFSDLTQLEGLNYHLPPLDKQYYKNSKKFKLGETSVFKKFPLYLHVL